MRREILGVVLCGGASSRMGRDKASLEVRRGVSQLDYMLGVLDTVCLKRAVCEGTAERRARVVPSGVLRIEDSPLTRGPMAGVIAALRAAAGWPVLVFACDMPYLEVCHAVQLVNRRDAGKLATSFVSEDGMLDPMATLYEAAALPVLEGLAAEGKSSLRRFLCEAEAARVEPADGRFLASVNDLAAFNRARRELGGE